MNPTLKKRMSNGVIILLTSLLGLLLAAQAIILACILIYGFIPIPTDLGNRLIARQISGDFKVSATEYRLRADASLDLIGIEVRANHIEQSLFNADLAEINIHWRGLFNSPELTSFVLSEGTLYVPSVHSPTGDHTPLLERIALSIVPTDDFFTVARFAALHESIRLRGAFDIPKRSGEKAIEDEPKDPKSFVAQFYKQASVLFKQKERIDSFESPTIAFTVVNSSEIEQKIALHISSPSYDSAPTRASDVQLEASLKLKEGNLTLSTPPRLSARKFNHPKMELAIDNLNAQIDPIDLSSLLQKEWPSSQIAASHISLYDYELHAPILTIDTKDLPIIDISGATQSLNAAINLDGQFNIETLAAQIQAKGSVDLAKIESDALQKAMPEIHYEAPPYYDINLNFGPSLKLKEGTLRAQVENPIIDNLHIDYIDSEAHYHKGIYTIESLYMRRDNQWMDLSLHFDSTTNDYKLNLGGSVIPTDYNELLPGWWGRIFSKMDFTQTTDSRANFVVYGNTKRKQSDLLFGRVEARGVGYSGIHLDSGQLIVRGRGDYTELHDLDVESGGDWARGNIHFVSNPDPIPDAVSVRIDMETKLHLSKASKILDGGVGTIVDSFESEGSPTLQLDIAIFNNAYPACQDKDYFNVFAQCHEPISFKGVPFDYLNFELYGRSESTHLREIDFGYADGKGTAKLDISHSSESDSSLRYQLSLIDADQNQAIRNLPYIDELEDSIETAPEIESKPNKREEARLDFTLTGEGPSHKASSHYGFGRLNMRSDKLGTIQLLGPLSRLLQKNYISFTSFNLDTLDSQFSFENNVVSFSDMEVNGPLTKMQSLGSLDLNDQSVDFRVSVFLFGNAGDPESRLRKIGDLIKKPIPNLLEFKVTGTVEQQKIRSLYDPRKFIPLLN